MATSTTSVTVRVPPGDPGALARALAQAPPRATLLVPEGVHAGPLLVKRDVTIRGAGPTRTRLSGGRKEPVVVLAEAGVKLRLQGVSLTEGAAPQGAGLAILAAGRVLLEEVVLSDCRAGTGGGAIYVAGGTLGVRRALVQRCGAPKGGGLLLDGTSVTALDDVVIEENDASEGGGLFLREGAKLSLTKCFVRRNGAGRGASALEALGSLSRAPRIEVAGGALAGGRPTVRLRAPRGAAGAPVLTAKGATIAAELKALQGFEDGGGNSWLEPAT